MKNALGWLVLAMSIFGSSSKTQAASTAPRWAPYSLSPGLQAVSFTGDSSYDSIDFYVEAPWTFGSGANVYWDLYRPDADHSFNPEWYSFQLSWSGADWPMTVVGEGTGQYTYTNYTWYFDSDNYVDPVWIWSLQWGDYLGPGWANLMPNQYCYTYEYPIYSWAGKSGIGSLQRELIPSWRLWTGGEEGSTRLNFFRVYATAYDITYASNIPPTLITVAGQQCDTNGYAYFSAADNQWVGCTPEVAATADYSFNVTPVKASLKIFRGGDITDKTNTVVVGERIALTCGFDNDLAPITNFLWSVPGTIVSNYITTSTNGLIVNHRNPQDYTNSGMNFHWIDGSGTSLLEVECTIKSKGVTLTAKTKFKVIRPTGSLGAEMPGTIAIGPDGNGTPWLIFGLLLNTNPGVIFRGSNMAPSEVATNGHWFFAQTGATTIKYRSNGLCLFYSTNGLDAFPYPSLTSSPLVARDSPGNDLFLTVDKLSRNDSFVTYLMFSNKTAGSIPVAIQQTEWFWGGAGTNVSGTWAAGSLLSSTNGFGAVNVSSTGLPQWNHYLPNKTYLTNASMCP